jgi:DMSO/TMAO reductase YedYZ molybdopterin-dependent catalytic subunit
LIIQAETGNRVVLGRTEIEALPRTIVATGGPQPQTKFEGVGLKLLLEKAGVGFGESLRGKRLASCLVVEAADGYRIVMAWPELDPAFNEKEVLLAFLQDGKALDDKHGPYRLVIPNEKRMARWVKRVTTLRTVDLQ